MSKVFHFHCECKTVKLASRALYSGLPILSGLFRVFWCTKVKEARLERSAAYIGLLGVFLLYLGLVHMDKKICQITCFSWQIISFWDANLQASGTFFAHVYRAL